MSWCAVCGTQHDAGPRCPGPLLATGIERHGRAVAVHLDSGRQEVFGVLVAQAGDCWRARVLTYPNMLWSVPGGRGTIKFVGGTAQEAERRAFEFLRRHCSQRGIKIIDENPDVASAAVRPEGSDLLGAGTAQDLRHLRSMRVRFGEKKATTEARTANLSVGGLFVVTDKPLPTERGVKLMVDMGRFTVPLTGRVAWVRTGTEQGRPRGMGIHLSNPPPLYLRFVKALAKATDADGGEPALVGAESDKHDQSG